MTGPGAVVIGGDYQGLGIVRSLGRRGVDVHMLDDEISIGGHSRFACGNTRVADLRSGTAVVEALLALARRPGLAGAVLFPTREELVAALAHHRDVLAPHFRVPALAPRAVEAVHDKRCTYRLAARLGIPVPTTWYPADVTELDAINVDGPFVVKPAIKENFLYATGAKAWRADDHRQLAEMFTRAARILPPGEIMVQELIPGDGAAQFAYCAFVKDGEPRASMTACRRRQHPTEFGRSSSFVVTVDLPELEELSAPFLREIRYHGLVEMEYKRDPRCGTYKLLDVNARTWGYHTLGHLAGVDFPYLLFADQVGLPVPEGRARPGVAWVRLLTDIPEAVSAVAHGRMSARDYLASLRTCRGEAAFAWDDPVPAVLELGLVPYVASRRGWGPFKHGLPGMRRSGPRL
jgi:D-aspartate ligase